MPPRKVKKVKPENVVWRSDAPSTGSGTLKSFDGGGLFEGEVLPADSGAGLAHVLRKEDCEFSAKSAAILASLDARAREEEAERALKAHNDIILVAATDFAGANAGSKDDASSSAASLQGNSGGSAQPTFPRNTSDCSAVCAGDGSGKDLGQRVNSESASIAADNATSSSGSGCKEDADSIGAAFQYKGASFGHREARSRPADTSAASAPLPCHPLNSWFLSEGIPNFSRKSARGRRLYEHEVDKGVLRSMKRVRAEPQAADASAATGSSSFDVDVEWGADAVLRVGQAAEEELLLKVREEGELERQLEQSLIKQLRG